MPTPEERAEKVLTAEKRAQQAYNAWMEEPWEPGNISTPGDQIRLMLEKAIREAEERGYARGNLNNATLIEADMNGYKRAMSMARLPAEQIAAAEERGRVEMREKFRTEVNSIYLASDWEPFFLRGARHFKERVNSIITLLPTAQEKT
jgi:hypothetical protein